MGRGGNIVSLVNRAERHDYDFLLTNSTESLVCGCPIGQQNRESYLRLSNKPAAPRRIWDWLIG